MTIQIKVFITKVSGERLWAVDDPIPPHIQISTNVSIIDFKRENDEKITARFHSTINYNPSVAQMNMSGITWIIGKPHAIKKIHEQHQKRKPSPQLIHSITRTVIVEGVSLSRSLGVPPPIPLPTIPPARREKKGPPGVYT